MVAVISTVVGSPLKHIFAARKKHLICRRVIEKASGQLSTISPEAGEGGGSPVNRASPRPDMGYGTDGIRRARDTEQQQK